MQTPDSTPARALSPQWLFWRGFLVRLFWAIPVALPILLFSHKPKWSVAPGLFLYLPVCIAGGFYDMFTTSAARLRPEKPSNLQIVVLLIILINLAISRFF